MKICTKCHTQNPDEALLCSNCGEDITKKYIRKHAHRVKHRRSRPSKKRIITLKAKIFGVALVVIFIISLVLIFYHSSSE